jgi:spore coat polysaccharide biosynthesis protein SpsF
LRVVAIIQARMGSSRLPGKILKLLAGKPVLEHVIGRVREAAIFDEIAVATTDRGIDDKTAQAAAQWGATVVRGDEQDVLARYGLAASVTRADAIMRVTADCPLIDPDVLRAMAQRYVKGDVTLVTNARNRTFPRGLDAEIFSRAALEIMLSEAHEQMQREHVTPFLYAYPHRFKISDYIADFDHSDLRLTLDTPEDFQLLQLIFEATAHPEQLRLQKVLAILEANREWKSINAHIEQKKA